MRFYSPNQLMAVLAISLMHLAPCAAEVFRKDDNVVVLGERAGFFTKTTSEADLAKILRKGEFRREVVQLGDGQVCGTEIYPGTERSLIIVWQDPGTFSEDALKLDEAGVQRLCELLPPRTVPASVLFRTKEWWQTADGVKIGSGMSLLQLERANRAPVSFASGSFCGDGAVVSWHHGRFGMRQFLDADESSGAAVIGVSLTYEQPEHWRLEDLDQEHEGVNSKQLPEEFKRQTTVAEFVMNFRRGRLNVPLAGLFTYSLAGASENQVALLSYWPEGKVFGEYESSQYRLDEFVPKQPAWIWCDGRSARNQIESVEQRVEPWGDKRTITRVALTFPLRCSGNNALLSNHEIPKQRWYAENARKQDIAGLREHLFLNVEKAQRIVTDEKGSFFFFFDPKLQEPYEKTASGGYRLLDDHYQEIARLVRPNRLEPIIDLDGDTVPEFLFYDTNGAGLLLYRLFPAEDSNLSRHSKGPRSWQAMKRDREEEERRTNSFRNLRGIIAGGG